MYRSNIFHVILLTFSASFSIFHIVARHRHYFIYKCFRLFACMDRIYIRNSFCMGTVEEAIEGLYFLVSVPACLPPATSYMHCTSVVSLRWASLFNARIQGTFLVPRESGFCLTSQEVISHEAPHSKTNMLVSCDLIRAGLPQ